MPQKLLGDLFPARKKVNKTYKLFFIKTPYLQDRGFDLISCGVIYSCNGNQK